MLDAAPTLTPTAAPSPAAPTAQLNLPPGVQPIIAKDGTPLDPSVVNLAKAIRTVESNTNYNSKGGSGEFGAYQWMPGNFQSNAKKLLGINNADPKDPVMQDKVAYAQILKMKAAGLTPQQVASAWNSGNPDAYKQGVKGVNSKGVSYDVPGYVNKVMAAFQKVKNQTPSTQAPAAAPDLSANFQIPPTPGQAADQASAAQYKPTFSSNTQNPGALEALKTVGNIPKSAFNFAKGAADLVNPASIVNKVGQIGGAFSGLQGDLAAQKAAQQATADTTQKLIQQYQQLQAAGKDTSHIESFMKNYGIDPNKIPTPEKTPSAFRAGAAELPGAAVTSMVPEAGRAFGRVIQGSFTGNQNMVDENLQRAQRAITNDPVGQILPFLVAAKAGAGALDRTGATTGAAAALDTAGSKVAQTAIKPLSYAFGKASGAAGAVTGFGSDFIKSNAAKAVGIEPHTLSTIVNNPEAFTKENMANTSRVGLAQEVQDALGGKAKELGVTPESLGQEIQSALAKRSAALEDTGKGYQSIRELEAANTEMSPAETKVIKQGKSSLVYDLKEAPNDQLSLPELRQKASLMEKSGNYSKAELGAVNDLIDKRTASEPIPHEIKVSPNYLDNTIKKTTGLKITKDGELQSSGAASIRELKDVKALKNLYDTWKPTFAKGKLTTTELLNFRSDLAKLSRFDREITSSAPLENLSKIMRAEFNKNFRGKVPGLQALDEAFSKQKGEIKELSAGLVDKNGTLTDAGLRKIAKASESNPKLLAQLEKIAPGITEKINALHDFKELSKGLIDANGELTETAINRIANATGKGKDLLLQRLEEAKPGITKKIQILKAVEDIQSATGNKVGTYTRNTDTGLAAAGGYIFGGVHGAILGAVIERILTSPEMAVPILRKYGLLKNSAAVGAVVSGLKNASETAKVGANSQLGIPAQLKKTVPITVFGRPQQQQAEPVPTR